MTLDLLQIIVISIVTEPERLSSGSDRWISFCSYMLYQHVPTSYAKMNEYLPNHLYFSNVTAPVFMTQVPASLLLNRFVMKRRIKFGRPDERTQRRMAFVRSESALSCVWMPFNDYIVTAWNNGKIVKVNGVNYQYSGQQDVISLPVAHF